MYIPPKCPNSQTAGQSDCDLTRRERKLCAPRSIRPSCFFFGQIALLAIPICALFCGFYLSNLSLLFVLSGGGFMIMAVLCAVFLIAPCYRTNKYDDYLPLTKCDSSQQSKCGFRLVKPYSSRDHCKSEELTGVKGAEDCPLHAPSTDSLKTPSGLLKTSPRYCGSSPKFPLSPIPTQNIIGMSRCQLITPPPNQPIPRPCTNTTNCGASDHRPEVKAGLRPLHEERTNKLIDITPTSKCDAVPGDASSKPGSCYTFSTDVTPHGHPILIKLYPISSKEGTYQWKQPPEPDNGELKVQTPSGRSPRGAKNVSQELNSSALSKQRSNRKCEFRAQERGKPFVFGFNIENERTRRLKFECGVDQLNGTSKKWGKANEEYVFMNDDLFLDFILNRGFYEECRESLRDASYVGFNAFKRFEVRKNDGEGSTVNNNFSSLNSGRCTAVREQRQLQALFAFTGAQQATRREKTAICSKTYGDRNVRLALETGRQESDSPTTSPPRTKKCRWVRDQTRSQKLSFENETAKKYSSPTRSSESERSELRRSNFIFNQPEWTKPNINDHQSQQKFPPFNEKARRTETRSQHSDKSKKISQKVESTFFRKSSSLYDDVFIEKTVKQKKKTLKQFK